MRRDAIRSSTTRSCFVSTVAFTAWLGLFRPNVYARHEVQIEIGFRLVITLRGDGSSKGFYEEESHERSAGPQAPMPLSIPKQLNRFSSELSKGYYLRCIFVRRSRSGRATRIIEACLGRQTYNRTLNIGLSADLIKIYDICRRMVSNRNFNVFT